MMAGKPLFLLLSLSLVLLIPRLTQAFWKISIKKPNLETKILAQLDTFTSDATKSLEEMNKSVYAMVKQRRQSICCYDVVNQDDKQSLSLRSAIYTTIVALSRLQDATSEYRQQLNQKCSKCDVPPGKVLCSTEEYPCPSEPEKCITGSQMCDGKPDCSDSSDEKLENCYKNPCEYDAICEENQLCIPSSYRCDGRWDCPHGSDETVCVVPHTQCKDDQFQCVSDDKCVPSAWRCDGEEDCEDGSDEASCPHSAITTTPSTPTTPTTKGCGPDQLRCISSGDCMPGSFRCDGELDCLDGSDEKNCSTVRGEPCEENPCSHRCEPAPWTNQGFFCSCPKGMELQQPDRHNCVAIGLKGIKGAISGTKGIKG